MAEGIGRILNRRKKKIYIGAWEISCCVDVYKRQGVSRSTLFRRIKEAKKQGVDYIE